MTDQTPNACPFCSFPDLSIVSVRYQNDEARTHIRCPQCGAQGPAGKNSDEALELWADRKLAPAPAGPRACPYCESLDHTDLACPKVKAFDFQLSGNVARVEFKTAADYPAAHFEHMIEDSFKMASHPGFLNTATSSDDVPTS